MPDHDDSLDNLLLLDGERLVYPNGYFAKFVIKRTTVSKARPHGLKYSLSFHDDSGQRVLGFDNAHAVTQGTGPGKRTRVQFDHKHEQSYTSFYEYENAYSLLSDFWQAVEEFMKELNHDG
jgi:hypothetical protein